MTPSSAKRGGVTMCIGSTRYNASEDAIKAAVVATPIGGMSAPVKSGDGYVVLNDPAL